MDREAVKKDILFIGTFTKPGSPARDKEPFLAFHRLNEPERVSCIRNGDRFVIVSEKYPDYNGRRVSVDTHSHDPRSARNVLEREFVFDGTEERVPFSKLPQGEGFGFMLIHESLIMPRYKA